MTGGRMTRARVKTESSAREEAPANTPVIRNLPSREHSISSTASPMPHTNGHQQHSSGSTVRTSFDNDQDTMRPQPHHTNGAPATNGNGRMSHDDMDTSPHASARTLSPPPANGADAMQQLGAQSRDLIKAIKNLEALNIEATLSSLPKFVVVGDQSAGKSSIIEALCDILLPRSQGTCTRCPFQITTSAKAGTWKCTVSLRRDFARDPTARAGPSIVYDGWRPLATPETDHFATVNNKQDLGTVLKAAQQAILNPHMDPQSFVTAHAQHQTSYRSVKFSPNVITLDIEASELPELSFYDLPGSINVHEDDNEQHLVGFIEKLVTSHLRDEKTLVLLACAADQDIENSTTFRYVKQCKAQGRCSGVLTKPDLMSPAKFDLIKRVLARDVFKLAGPWFVTKQLSQAEIDMGISHGEARQREHEFFQTGRWAEDPGMAKYLGIANLQKAVADSLVAHILSELPTITQRVDDRYADVNNALAMFPEQPLHPTLTVFTEIQKLVSSVTEQIEGARIENPFLQEYRGAIRDFSKHLSDMKPEVDCTTPGYEKPAFELSDDDEMDTTPTHTPSKAPPSAKATPVRQMLLPSASASSSRKRKVEEDLDTPLRGKATANGIKRSKAAQSAVCKLVFPRTTFKLDEVRARYEAGDDLGLTDVRNRKVTDHLILTTLKDWHRPLKHLLETLAAAVKDLLHGCTADVLAKRLHTELYRQTSKSLDGFIANKLQEQANVLRHILACERDRPNTLQPMTTGNAECLAALKAKRMTIRIDEFCDMAESQQHISKATKPADRKKLLIDENWQAKNLGADTWTEDFQDLARIQNYYNIAARGFVDSVLKQLNLGLVRAVKDEVKQVLEQGLKVGDSAHCANLLVEDPQREIERARLLDEKEKLEAARQELAGVADVARA